MARIRRPLYHIYEAVEFNRGIERRQADLPGSDRLGEQGIDLTNVERIAAGEVVWDIDETTGDGQVFQFVASLCALNA